MYRTYPARVAPKRSAATTPKKTALLTPWNWRSRPMASRQAQLLPEIVDQQRHDGGVGEAAEVDRAGVEHLGATTGLVVGHLCRATRAEDVLHPRELDRSLWRRGSASVDLDSVTTGNHAAVVEAGAQEEPRRQPRTGNRVGLVPVDVTVP